MAMPRIRTEKPAGAFYGPDNPDDDGLGVFRGCLYALILQAAAVLLLVGLWVGFCR